MPAADDPVPQSPASGALPAGILDALPVGVALVDAAGRIVLANESWRQSGAAGGPAPFLFGRPGDDYPASGARAEGADPAQLRTLAAGLRQVLAGEKSRFVHDYTCPPPAPVHRFRLIISRLGRPDGGAVALGVDLDGQPEIGNRPPDRPTFLEQAQEAIDRDSTERKEAEARIARDRRLASIGALASGMTHDLNNILSPLLMAIDLLDDERLTVPQRARILDNMRKSTQRGSTMVRQVLSFARGMEGARTPVQPRHLLGELGGILRETFPGGIRINVPPCGPLWTVSGDPLQLHQALLNLCLNARDAMPRGGVLTLSAENRMLDESGEARPGPYVAFKIAATGATRSETRDRIVSPPFTGRETGDGAAPGLSTALAIVKGHQGFAHLGSQAGLGTVFQIFLPADVSPADEAVAAPDHPAPLGDGELILVVDDEEAILDISRRTLEKRGYRVLTAAEGATAVALYAQHAREIAVVLTDMAMPVMDGISTLHALRRINPSVKVVASSGMGSNVNAARITDAGIEFFLRKPYRVDTLLKILREAIDSPAPSSAHN